MYLLWQLVYFLTVLVWTARSDTDFINPPNTGSEGIHDAAADNPTYKVGQTIKVKWITELTYFDVYLMRFYPKFENGSVEQTPLLQNVTTDHTFWTISKDNLTRDNLPDGVNNNMFYFDLRAIGNDMPDGQSHDFNITFADTESSDESTSSTATATASAASATGTTTRESSGAEMTSEATTATAPSATTGASGASGGDVIPTGVIIGLAVGATIGGISVVAGLVFLLWRHRKKKRDAAAAAAEVAARALEKAELPWGNEVNSLPTNIPHPPAELHDRAMLAELHDRAMVPELNAGSGSCSSSRSHPRFHPLFHHQELPRQPGHGPNGRYEL